MSTPPVQSTAPILSLDKTDAADGKRPGLLYPGFPAASLSGFLRDLPEPWLIWYAQAEGQRAERLNPTIHA
jgi:hypothetical protein